MTTENPIPCPFCGGAGLRHVPYELKGYDHPALDIDGALSVTITGDGWYAVRCGDCNAMGPRVKATKAKGIAKAIAAWNDRHAEQMKLSDLFGILKEDEQ